MKIKFLTDSVCDIPDDLLRQYNITVAPIFVNFGGQSFADDGVELKRDDFYRRLRTLEDYPQTSAMSPELARTYIDRAYADADHLFIITTPKGLSGIYNAMRLGSSHLPPERVTLIDSGQLSIGMGWQVLIGAQVAQETGDVAQTHRAIMSAQANQHVYCTVGSLDFLRRSGRVSWAAASIGNFLNIKPVVQSLDGQVHPIARVRTFNRALDKLAELAYQHAPYDKFAILHILNEEGFHALQERLADILPPDTIVGTVGPALGTHVGPGAVGFAAVSKGWKDAIST
ncbi:MAG: DegV family protein [bacterium]|nr:DegV family protein [bacterium]